MSPQKTPSGCIGSKNKKQGARMGAHFYCLAAAAALITAAVIAAAVAAVIAAAHIAAAAVAEQKDQDDDPANITTAETVIVTHKINLRKIFSGICRSFQDIPEAGFGAKKGGVFRCWFGVRP